MGLFAWAQSQRTIEFVSPLNGTSGEPAPVDRRPSVDNLYADWLRQRFKIPALVRGNLPSPEALRTLPRMSIRAPTCSHLERGGMRPTGKARLAAISADGQYILDVEENND